MTALIKSILLGAALALFTAGAAQAKDESKTAAPSKPAASSSAAADKVKSSELIDINSASEKELATLPKIGEVRAKAIVKGRPYHGKDELVEKKIISQDVYDGIKDRIIAKQKPAAADKKAEAKKGDTKK
jgi:DNA uptake protein ComE-like DNA-binding protein